MLNQESEAATTATSLYPECEGYSQMAEKRQSKTCRALRVCHPRRHPGRCYSVSRKDLLKTSDSQLGKYRHVWIEVHLTTLLDSSSEPLPRGDGAPSLSITTPVTHWVWWYAYWPNSCYGIAHRHITCQNPLMFPR